MTAEKGGVYMRPGPAATTALQVADVSDDRVHAIMVDADFVQQGGVYRFDRTEFERLNVPAVSRREWVPA